MSGDDAGLETPYAAPGRDAEGSRPEVLRGLGGYVGCGRCSGASRVPSEVKFRLMLELVWFAYGYAYGVCRWGGEGDVECCGGGG